MSSLLVAAINFGTTFSGYAFSFLYDYKRDPLKISANSWNAGIGHLVTLKTSTCVLFDAAGNFHSFGFEAEEKYSDLALDEIHHNWYYFRCFKLMLYDKTVQMSFYFNFFFNLLQEIEFWAFLKFLLVYFRLLRPSIGTKERNFDRGRHNGKKWKS